MYNIILDVGIEIQRNEEKDAMNVRHMRMEGFNTKSILYVFKKNDPHVFHASTMNKVTIIKNNTKHNN